jgi:hypothetical protein
MLPESQSPSFNASSQITRAGFFGKDIWFIIHPIKRTGRINLSKLCCPTSGRKYPPFKGEIRGPV